MTITRVRGLAAMGVASALLAGCGGGVGNSAHDATGGAAASPQGGTHTMADGSTMADSQMPGSNDSSSGMDMHDGADSSGHAASSAEDASAPGAVTHRDHGPSEAAGMICSREVALGVQRTFSLPKVPRASDTWAGGTYTCTYQLSSGRVRLSVKDLNDEARGRAFFDALRARLPGARPIRGLQSLGFPGLETRGAFGDVVFLKDHKTLWVDAGDVASTDLAPGFSRTASAYSIAAAVMACWSE